MCALIGAGPDAGEEDAFFDSLQSLDDSGAVEVNASNEGAEDDAFYDAMQSMHDDGVDVGDAAVTQDGAGGRVRCVCYMVGCISDAVQMPTKLQWKGAGFVEPEWSTECIV